MNNRLIKRFMTHQMNSVMGDYSPIIRLLLTSML